VALLGVLCAGIAASLGACAAVRLPVIAAYVAGTGTSKRHNVVLAVLFTIGFVLGTVVLGLSAVPAEDGTHHVLAMNKYAFWLLGLSLFVVGVSISGLIHPRFVPEKYQRIAEGMGKLRTPGAVLLGGAFGLLQTPTAIGGGPDLLIVVEALAGQAIWPQVVLVLLAFAVGESIILLATGILTSLIEPDLARRFRKWMCSVEHRIQLLAGNVLMILGIYFVIVG
jgi:cytochrome c biogenesis protein CcdA